MKSQTVSTQTRLQLLQFQSVIHNERGCIRLRRRRVSSPSSNEFDGGRPTRLRPTHEDLLAGYAVAMSMCGFRISRGKKFLHNQSVLYLVVVPSYARIQVFPQHVVLEKFVPMSVDWLCAIIMSTYCEWSMLSFPSDMYW